MEDLQKIIKSRVQLIGGTASDWVGKKLLKNEAGIEWEEIVNEDSSISYKLIGVKFGDGVSTWEQLEYFGGAEAQVFSDITLQEGETHEQAIARETEGVDLNVGDIAIIKELIVDNKYSYTAYVYDFDADDNPVWKAMDGNVDAKNVYYSSDIQVTTTVGNITTSNNKPVDLKFAGKNLEQIWQYLYATEDVDLSIIQPNASMSATGSKSAEVGTSFSDPVVSITFSDGSYEYGSKDEAGTTYTKANGAGVVWNAASIYVDGVTDALATKTDASNSKFSTIYDITNNIIQEGTVTYKFTGKASCPASVRKPITNLGNFIDSNKEPTTSYSKGAKQTAAITDKALSASVTITGWRGCFWGYKAGGSTLDVSALTSDQIRELKSGGDTIQSTLKSYDTTNPFITNKMQQMFFAAPKGKYTSVTVANAVNGAPQTIYKISDIMVQGYNGFAATAYDIWYVSNDNADSGEAKYAVTIA